MNKAIYEISYKMRKELYQRIRSIFIAVLITVIALNIILSFFIFPVRNKSTAMEPDVVCGGMEFVCPLIKTPSRGEVFLIQDAQENEMPFYKSFVNSVCSFITLRQWRPFEEDFNYDAPHIRRVIGIPGDTIYLDRYDVYIMPAGADHFLTEFELTSTAYHINFIETPTGWDQTLGTKGKTDKIILGEDEYFVLGDNRTSSSDSRLWGPVPKKYFAGKVVLQYFPFDKFAAF